MTDPSDDAPEAAPPSAVDALRAEIANTRAELARASELLSARLARRASAADDVPADDVPTADVTTPDVTAQDDAAQDDARPDLPIDAADESPPRDAAIEHISARHVEVLPAPGRNLPALRPALAQRGFVAGLAVAAVVYLLTRRRRRF